MPTVPTTRPAHAPGPTYLAYTPNGRKLITVGTNDSLRVFDTRSDSEPINIDDCNDQNTAVVATNEFFIVGSDDGSVCKYSLTANALDQVLVRCTLPIRDLALSPDGQWVAVASDEIVVKVVNTTDMGNVVFLRHHQKPIKHLSFDHSGSRIAASCSDGIIYIYSLASETPELVKRLDGIIRLIDNDLPTYTKVLWHPDGHAFAAQLANRDITVVSSIDWEQQRPFVGGHKSDVTCLAWSPNGALLVTVAADNTIAIWNTKTQKVIQTYTNSTIDLMSFAWHPSDNAASCTNSDGELVVYDNFVGPEHAMLLDQGLQRAPYIHDPLAEVSGNARHSKTTSNLAQGPSRKARQGTPDSLDDILGPDADSADGFLEDDDGAGYAESINNDGKRSYTLQGSYDRPSKRRAKQSAWESPIHQNFQPGSTPWRGNRRYLCLNLIGAVWTVGQDTHRSVTVEFFDREFRRDFHFTDTCLYDKACLTDKGTLFASQASDTDPAMIYYRPHEHWTSDHPDWRASLPKGENVVAMALSESYIAITTSSSYVRIYTLFGTPTRVHRQKSSPVVTCASWRDYILTIGNGTIGGDGKTRLVYSIENVKRDEVCQNEDLVALTEGAQIQNVFFSDAGDPFIFDSQGVLLVLLHWRTPGQARWVPLLDTRQLDRLAGGRKEETYWPVAVARDKFFCIILKGGERHPYFPRPLLTEFDFHVSLSTAAPTKDGQDPVPDGEAKRLEESFVRESVMHALHEDLVNATNASRAQTVELGQKALEIDKTLLQLLAAECIAGEDRGMKALEIVELLQDPTGRIIEAARKVAARYGRDVLGEKIGELAERRLVGLDDEHAH